MKKILCSAIFLCVFLGLSQSVWPQGVDPTKPKLPLPNVPVAKDCPKPKMIIQGKCRVRCIQSECNAGERGLWVPKFQACYCFGLNECLTDQHCDGGKMCQEGVCKTPCEGISCDDSQKHVEWQQEKGCVCVGEPERGLCVDNRDCPRGQKCLKGKCRVTCSAGECLENKVCVEGYCYEPEEVEP